MLADVVPLRNQLQHLRARTNTDTQTRLLDKVEEDFLFQIGSWSHCFKREWRLVLLVSEAYCLETVQLNHFLTGLSWCSVLLCCTFLKACVTVRVAIRICISSGRIGREQEPHGFLLCLFFSLSTSFSFFTLLFLWFPSLFPLLLLHFCLIFYFRNRNKLVCHLFILYIDLLRL